jgi:malonate decarboxylase gamma subunit
MTLDKILASLFPNGHAVERNSSLLLGSATLADGTALEVIGAADRAPLGIDEAIRLSRRVLDIVARGGREPILVLLDSDSQRMSKRDELLGLNEFLAHLAKALLFADLRGHRTIGLLYGHTAAGAFIATALSTRTLVALPGAEPAVMDLPSMSKVTKLPIEVLEEKAKSTPVFAPGVANVERMGAIAATWDENVSLATQLQALLATPEEATDTRDRLGKERNGRPKAADIAERVHALALGRS